MNLRYINLWIDPSSGYDDDYRYEFKLHTRFINHFLSIRIRKEKFETDGSFNMISVAPIPDYKCEIGIVPLDALRVTVPFDKSKYEKIKNTEKHEYYLELLERGFEDASKIKSIPYSTLMKLLDEFKHHGYKNEWLHKRKKFKEYDLEIVLECKFTSFDFQLIIFVSKISSKELLITETIIRTLPDEIYFDKMFKDILIHNGEIVVTDASDSPRVKISLKEVYLKRIEYQICGDKDVKNLLSYKGNSF